MWVPLVALIVGYVMAHRALAPIDSASPGSAAASVELVGNFLARNAVPGFVGGPWADPGASTIVIPTTWAVALGWTVLVVVVALTLYRSRSAVWGWLLLLGLHPARTPSCSSAVGPVRTSARRWD